MPAPTLRAKVFVRSNSHHEPRSAARKDDDGFFRFHPSHGAVMHQKLLREVAAEVGRLNMADAMTNAQDSERKHR